MAEEDHLIAFLSNHQNDIIDWVNKNTKTQFTPTGNMFDRLANQATALIEGQALIVMAKIFLYIYNYSNE